MQPLLTQVPPNRFRSIIATFIPVSASRTARDGPACPVPITIASYLVAIGIPRLEVRSKKSEIRSQESEVRRAALAGNPRSLHLVQFRDEYFAVVTIIRVSAVSEVDGLAVRRPAWSRGTAFGVSD